MKKVLLMIFAVLGIMSCVSVSTDLNYSQPAIDIPNAYVIDSSLATGNLRDNIRLHNQSKETGISFRVYVHEPETKTWQAYGIGYLKAPGDTDFISSIMKVKLNNIRYYAIEPLDGNEYKYEFNKTRNDLYIFIFDK